MNYFGLTDKGSMRPSNQDSFVVLNKGKLTAGFVCDGIGGNKAGDVASTVSCQHLSSQFKACQDITDPQLWLESAVNKTNEHVYKMAVSNTNYNGMGTTLVGFIDDGKRTIVINIGDSRCYALIDGKMQQITEDHTLINELVKRRNYSYEVASRMVGKNVIARAVGIGYIIESDLYEVKDYKCLLLCSDGLHGYVDEAEIEAVLNENIDVKSKCRKLINMANQAGGMDNITVIIYQR